MQNYRFSDLVGMITATRSAIPYSMPLHLFGAGHPLTMAISVALGCDTFDSASYILFAREGRYMTERGVSRLETMKYLPCSCEVCARSTLKDLLELNHSGRTAELAKHNLHILRKEIETCKEAIVEGRLWDLIREKGATHPRLHEAISEIAKARDLLKAGTPPFKGKGLFVRDEFDLSRPEVIQTAEKLGKLMIRSSKTAVLLCDDPSQPSLKSGLKREVKSGSDVYRLHPAFGPYPIELEFSYPFSQTVMDRGMAFQVSPEKATKLLRKVGYRRVIVIGTGKSMEREPTPRSKRSRRDSSPSVPSSSARPR
jgi:7-cyano-7-deazaguanine tRNA-ribosyltransferase